MTATVEDATKVNVKILTKAILSKIISRRYSNYSRSNRVHVTVTGLREQLH